MKIIQINVECGTGSTGRIASDLYKTLTDKGHKCMVAYGRGQAHNVPIKDTYRIGTDYDVYTHALLTRITDKTGFYSSNATKKLINKLETYDPDIIHLHNIHGYYINIEILFNFLSVFNKPIFWTLHDCWSFTGHCIYFEYTGCNKWMNQCNKCKQKTNYPASWLFDNSKSNYDMKKELFTRVKNMTIITPSKWLMRLVRQSFLSKYTVEVIPNGVDLSVFKHVESSFRSNNNLEDKYIILGVAKNWDKRKGLSAFLELSKILDDNYKIVLIGLTDKQKRIIPKNIMSIGRTNSITELAEIYSSSDVFVNPTLDDNFPTVNIEALACGIPVITYNTGGSIECVDETCGIVVENNSLDGLYTSIQQCKKSPFIKSKIIDRARLYNKICSFSNYLLLYENNLNGSW